ncbi:MAG: hypothetical protein L0211_22365 [Planctomycetaceae bacterium]|nr:hypothetical protein [Planctomycetaceae bacterium]
MCCFTGVVESVSTTQIFARPASEGRQYLVYHMQYKAKEPLAMVLPIPTPAGSADDAVKFINLEKYDHFFADLLKGFPVPRPAALPLAAGDPPPKAALPVVEVGSFEASFVPKIADFARLDARFRLPDGVWDKLPTYKNYGFAVFKLKEGNPKLHPMAFEFPRANTKAVFFPTVHIHDGKVHASAAFDHTLYLQPTGGRAPRRWDESPQPAGMFMDVEKSKGLISADEHVYRLRIAGRQKNEDTLV